MHASTSVLPRILILLCALAVPMGFAAQGAQDSRHVRYALEVLGSLGGTQSTAQGLNNKGSTAGQSFVTDSTVPVHAFFWQKGVMTDIGTLGGRDSLVNVANHTLNEKDMVVGYSETSIPDPNGEDFCNGLGTGLICLPFVWENGVLTALPTLGGNNGQALGINNRGQIVGQAEGPT
jgi:probable HAF family extracellular repeat protein